MQVFTAERLHFVVDLENNLVRGGIIQHETFEQFAPSASREKRFRSSNRCVKRCKWNKFTNTMDAVAKCSVRFGFEALILI